MLQVHDEFISDAHTSEIEIMKPLESAMELLIPVAAEVGLGNNWLESRITDYAVKYQVAGER